MNTGEMIALIKAFGGSGGGGSSLPSVTSADNGKVLAVKDGAWAADSNLFIVTKSGNTADKTFAQMSTAIDAGQGIILKDGNLTFYAYKKDNNYIYFNSGIINNAYYSTRCSNANVWSSVGFAYLPIVSSTDNGCEAVVKNGAWAKQQKKFFVTLTPTSPDFSGTMDKTVSEINAAYEAGMDIWFRFSVDANQSYDMPVASVINTSGYSGFVWSGIVNDMLIVFGIETLGADDTQYNTTVYSLTPAS